MSTAGLLLAAGAGRRMGVPKALVRPDPAGPTWLESTLAALAEGGLDRVVVVLGAGAEQARPLAQAAGCTVVLAPDWQEGMGASLRAGLTHLAAAAGPGVDAALVTLVDLPDVGPTVYRRVLDAALTAAPDRGPGILLRAEYRGVPGHPVLLGREHWAPVARVARGDRGARDHLAVHPPLPVECGELASGEDADTPESIRPRRG